MNVFLARQPILDKSNKIYGYELLFRDSSENSYNEKDGDKATLEVVRNSYLNIGMDKVVGESKAFINFTENLLKTDVFSSMSPKKVIVEILETVEPNKEIIEACKKIKEMGYEIALDDFAYDKKYKEMVELADIIKVDFIATRGVKRKQIIDSIKNNHIRFVAEKVETIEDFNEAVSYGYTYFQGYYFSKPVIIQGKKIPENKKIYIELLKEVNSKRFSIEIIENLIKKDVYLSFQLLKTLNSAKYCFKDNITSIKQALILLGEDEIKKWIYFITVKSIGNKESKVIVNESIVRAKFTEEIFEEAGHPHKSLNAYLIGLLSMIDVILERPLCEILEEILVPKAVKNALLHVEINEYSKVLDLIVCYEKAKWNEVNSLVNQLNINNVDLGKAYLSALNWANSDLF